jgi:hypothetical protein
MMMLFSSQSMNRAAAAASHSSLLKLFLTHCIFPMAEVSPKSLPLCQTNQQAFQNIERYFPSGNFAETHYIPITPLRHQPTMQPTTQGPLHFVMDNNKKLGRPRDFMQHKLFHATRINECVLISSNIQNTSYISRESAPQLSIL